MIQILRKTLSGLRASNSDIPAALSGPISGLPGPPGNKIGYQNLLWICLAGPQSGQPENLGIIPQREYGEMTLPSTNVEVVGDGVGVEEYKL